MLPGQVRISRHNWISIHQEQFKSNIFLTEPPIASQALSQVLAPLTRRTLLGRFHAKKDARQARDASTAIGKARPKAIYRSLCSPAEHARQESVAFSYIWSAIFENFNYLGMPKLFGDFQGIQPP